MTVRIRTGLLARAVLIDVQGVLVTPVSGTPSLCVLILGLVGYFANVRFRSEKA